MFTNADACGVYTDEFIWARDYDIDLKVTYAINNYMVNPQHANYAFTRQFIDTYLMTDGTPLSLIHIWSSDELMRRARSELDFRISSLEDFTTQSLFSSEIHEIVRQTLAEMPAQTRRIFEMSRFENRRNAEIAAELNLSIKTVEFHIGKVLKVLRVRLKDYLLFFFVFILR